MIPRIVFTGGPGSGKTTGLDYVAQRLRREGQNVIVVPEVATIAGKAGIAPRRTQEFQVGVIRLQIALEDSLRALGRSVFAGDDFIMLCDRGLIDGRAYVEEAVWDAALADRSGMIPRDALRRYSGVVHLETAAKVGKLSSDNNEFRSERSDEALWLCAELGRQWSAHPRYVSVPAIEDFTTKLQTLHKEVANLLVGLS